MIHIFHHIYPFGTGIDVALQQKNKLYNQILDPFNYIPSKVTENQNELHTLNIIQEKVKVLDDDDLVLYIHTKNATNFSSSNHEWRLYMEEKLIEKYRENLEILQRKFNTSGCLMGLPFWSQNIYGGNFWWAKVSYLKTLRVEIDLEKMNRWDAEFNFISTGKNWYPYNFPITKEDIDKYKNLFSYIINESYLSYKSNFVKNII